MKGHLVSSKFEVGSTPWQILVPEGALYIPEAKIKIYEWKDRNFYGLVERLNEQEFNDAKEFHARDLQEVELDEVVVQEISALFSKIEPAIPAMREIYRRTHRLRK